MIYLDHAASAPMLPQALEAQTEASKKAFANPGGVHRSASVSRRIVHQARKSIAKVLDIPDNSLSFTSGGTESNNWAIKMASLAGRHRGRHIITGAAEHKSILSASRALVPFGFSVTVLSPSPEGRILPEALERAIRPDTVLISLQSANNETGVVYDTGTFSSIANAHHIPLHCDAVQSFGHLALPLQQADLISLSAHTLGGPPGGGALIVRPGTPILPLLDGGGQELGLRSGTENVPGIAGFGAACETGFADLESEAAREAALSDLLLRTEAAPHPESAFSRSVR